MGLDPEQARPPLESHRLELATELAGVGNWSWDVQQNSTEWDDNTKRIYGFRPDQTLSFEEVNARTHPKDRKNAQLHVERALATGVFEPIEMRIVVDGEVRWVLSLGKVLFDDEGRPSHISGAVIDITKQRADQVQRQQESVLEVMGRLAGSIAHDFNNLLVPISTNASILGEQLEGEDSALIGEIDSAASRAADLVRRLLAVYRSDGDVLRTFDMGRRVRITLELVRRMMSVGARLRTEIAPGPLWVRAHEGAVDQVLLNLCLNARDATGADGSDVTVRLHAVDGQVHLMVEDGGVGIPQEHLVRVFEPFFSTKARGPGIGLSTVQEIATRYGGRASVESQEGKGSRFTVTFPEAEPKLQDQPDPESTGHRSLGTVVLADDEALVRRSVGRLLERAGWSVKFAPDGDEAIRLVETNLSLDAVILDGVMPGRSGISVGRELRDRFPGLALILCSGHLDAPQTEDLKTVFDGYLQKPFSSKELLSLLAHAVVKRRA